MESSNLTPALDRSPKTGRSSPQLPAKPQSSPKLPPKNPTVNSAVAKPHNQISTAQDDDDDDDEDDSALSNMPEHLRDRFKQSKRQSKIRKMSKGHEEPPCVQEIKEQAAEIPPQPLANSPFLQKQLPKSQGFVTKGNKPEPESSPKLVGKAKEVQEKPGKPGNSDVTSGKSVKDRMKMFSGSSSNDEPAPPPKSPVPQKWPPSNSFERKQPGGPSLGKPPVEETRQKMFPPKFTAENKKPIQNGKEPAAVPPLPNRNTKPSKFGASKPGDFGKRPPMPLPPTISYDDVS